MTIESNPKYLECCVGVPWIGGYQRRAHAQCACAQGKAHDWRIAESSRDQRAQTVCWRFAPLHARQSRCTVRGVNYGIDVGKPTQGSMIALKRVTRYLKRTRHFVNKLELDTDVDKHVTRLDGLSDSDWAGSTDRKSQSSGALFVDAAPVYPFSRRQIATSSGMAEFYAGCATAEEILLAVIDVLWLSS